MLSALNSLLDFLGFGDCRVKFLKVQRRMFRDDSRDLTRSDYDALTAAAKSQGKERLALLMETICATGIRVSEVRYITVEAAKAGRTEIALKGKIRTILLPSAMPGILTGVILAIGRIVGESAALLFTAGSGYYLPKNLFGKVLESGGTLTIQLYLFMQKAKYNEAFGVAVVLLVIVLAINALAKYLSHRFNVETR